MNLLRRIVCAIVGHRWRWIGFYRYPDGMLGAPFIKCLSCRRCGKTKDSTSPASPDRDGE